jgi:hypothetical protein
MLRNRLTTLTCLMSLAFASIRGFTITLARRADLVAFLQSLTDQALLEDSRFANPWLATRKPEAK